MSRRILLIEDDPTFCDVLAGQFGLDTTLVAVHTLAAGVREYGANPADLVILDLNLPESRGLESLRRFRESCPEAVVMVITGVLGLGRHCVRAGAIDYIEKPFTMQNLAARVELAPTLAEVRPLHTPAKELVRCVCAHTDEVLASVRAEPPADPPADPPPALPPAAAPAAAPPAEPARPAAQRWGNGSFAPVVMVLFVVAAVAAVWLSGDRLGAVARGDAAKPADAARPASPGPGSTPVPPHNRGELMDQPARTAAP